MKSVPLSMIRTAWKKQALRAAARQAHAPRSPRREPPVPRTPWCLDCPKLEPLDVLAIRAGRGCKESKTSLAERYHREFKQRADRVAAGANSTPGEIMTALWLTLFGCARRYVKPTPGGFERLVSSATRNRIVDIARRRNPKWEKAHVIELDAEPNFDEWTIAPVASAFEVPDWQAPVQQRILEYVERHGRLPKHGTIKASIEEFDAALESMRVDLAGRLDVLDTIAAETARR